jgi:DNA polymerase-3 subunit gamma/tau
VSKKQPENIPTVSATSKKPIEARIKKVVNLKNVGEDNSEKEKEEILDFVDQSFSEDQLQSALKEFSVELAKQGKAGESRLFDNEISHDNEIITLNIQNPVEEVRFNDIKSDLLLFLKKRLQNKQISIELRMEETQKKKMLYTPQEKFDYLVEKNPAIKELKNRLGLEFEF